MKHFKFHTEKVIGKLALFICMIAANQLFAQQRAQFTQYMFDGSLINPAYTGADDALSLTLINRNQWSGVEGAPVSQTLAAHTLFKSKQLGLGAIIHNDKIGIHQNMHFSLSAAYHFKIAQDHFFSFGMNTGVHYRSSDFSTLAFDPLIGNDFISDLYLDLGLGFYYRSPKLHIGFSMPDIVPNKSKLDEYLSSANMDINHFLFAKYIIQASRSIELQPSFLIKYLKDLPISYDLNLNANFKRVLTLGISYRKEESVDFLCLIQLTPQFQFAYAYDYPIGNLRNFTNGTHEIMVRYLFKFKHDNVESPR